MKFSLNHDAIGTRYSGSYSGDSGQDWSWEATATPEDSYWHKQAGMSRDEWAKKAQIGDRYYVAPSVYWARVE